MNEFIASVADGFERGDEQLDSKAREKQNVLRVQELYSAILAGDIAGFQAILSEDVEFEIAGPEEVPFSGRAKGRTAAVELVQHNFGQLDSQSPQIEDVLAQGDTVVVVGNERGKLREAEQEYQMTWVQRFRFSGDSITHFLPVFDTASLRDSI